jgi:carboxyl-terminal processing protease
MPPGRHILATMVAATLSACHHGPSEDFGDPPDDFELAAPLAITVCPGDSDAHATFDAFWFAFEAHYGAFDLRLPGGDWTALGQAACPELGDGDISDDALFDLMIALARNLDDGHVELTAPSLGRSEDAWVSAYPYYEELYELEYNAEARYLDAELSWGARDWISWGRIGEIGYVSITAMEDYSSSGELDDDVEAAARTMQKVVTDLADTKGLVVDVRANEGGWDGVSLEIAAWFAGPRTLAWSERVRNGLDHHDFTPWREVFVDAARPGAYAGPVVLLTSGGTFSAGDTFVLAMQDRDRVTLIGEPSSGHFSDQLGGVLPNGWWVVLSAEQYRASDGIDYEGKGVPVEIPIAFDVDAFAGGTDVMLEAALASLD